MSFSKDYNKLPEEIIFMNPVELPGDALTLIVRGAKNQTWSKNEGTNKVIFFKTSCGHTFRNDFFIDPSFERDFKDKKITITVTCQTCMKNIFEFTSPKQISNKPLRMAIVYGTI